MTLPELLTVAEARQVLSSGDVGRTLAWTKTKSAEEGLPWYLHALVAVGAWFAAAFLLGLAGIVLGRLLENAAACITIGALVILVAIHDSWRGAFLSQIRLALSVAGHGLVFGGVARLGRAEDSLTLCAIVLAILLYRFYPDRLHRFLSTETALLASTFWIFSKHHWFGSASQPLEPGLPGLSWRELSLFAHLAALTWIFGHAGARVIWRPLGYALGVSLVVLLSIPFFAGIFDRWDDPGYIRWEFSAAITLAILLSAGGWRRARKNREVWLCLVIALIALAATSSPAVLLALFFLVLGYGLQDRAWIAFGIILLPAFLFLHYYSLEQTLMRKALLLMGSGGVLLILRVALAKVRWVEDPAA